MLENVVALKPRHSKDDELVVIVKLMLTIDHQLMVMCYCSKCLQDVTILIPLSKLWDECPPNGIDFGEEDQKELHSLGVCLPNSS
jgi:hypothetical protein